jgi:Ser/Thr protein kinase RdoA (MazF antagonist)
MVQDTWPATPDYTLDNALTSSNLQQATQRFFQSIESTESIGSAHHLLRVTSGGESYVVREWPATTAADQVTLAARALDAAAATSGGRLPVPQPVGDTAGGWSVRIGDRLYSASSWLPGRPLARYGDFRTPDGEVIDVPLPASAPAGNLVLDAVRTIGRLHEATASIAAASPGSQATLSRVLKQSERRWSEQRKVVGDRAANSPEIRRWLRCGNRIFPVAAELLGHVGAIGGSTIIHGDIWPANLLIEGHAADRVLSGVVGWSSVAVGSPLIDLAHLAIHTSGWSGALAENILGAYSEVATLSPGDRRLLPVVAAVDLVPRVGWLLHLAYVDDRMIGHESQPVLRSGLKSLLVSLENLTNVLAPDAEWTQRRTSETRRSRADSPVRRTPGRETRPVRKSGSGQSRPGSPPGRPKKD